MTRFTVAIFNFQNGGFTPFDYNFLPLQRAFAAVDPPALILLNEGKYYRDNGNAGLYAAAEGLAEELGVPYVGLLGSMSRGPIPPAILYNPNVLTLRSWYNPDDPNTFDDKRNVARFAVRGSGTDPHQAHTEFLAFVAHFDSRSGTVRRQEAGVLDRYGDHELPVIGGGDLNSTASGPHLPQRDWMAAEYPARSHKGVEVNGVWGPDTAAVDHLIGRWDPATERRVDGCGFHAAAEVAWEEDPGKLILPTVNEGIDAGGGLLIDWLLVNRRMLPYLIPESYRVHTPKAGFPLPSDHRLVTATVDL